MRVTVVTTWLPTALAPASGSFVLRDCTAIRDCGQDVRIVHLVPPHQDDGSRRIKMNGMAVLRLPMTPSNPLSVARAAATLPRLLGEAQILHSMAMSSLFPLSVLDLAGGLTLPWVHTEHWSGLTNPSTLSLPLRSGRFLVGECLKRPDVVTAVCDYLAQPIRSYRYEADTVVVPCIVDPVDLTASPLSQHRPGNDIRLVTVGALVDRKDPLMCVDITARLIAQGANASMTFVGEGPLRSDVCKRAADLGIAERVRLTGTLDAVGVRAELAQADIFLGPTRGDNFFVSAAEAIVSGCPVIVSDAGGQTEYVTDANGTVLPSGADVAQWASAVMDTHNRLAHCSAQQIASTIGSRFSADAVGRGYCQVYERLVGQPPLVP